MAVIHHDVQLLVGEGQERFDRCWKSYSIDQDVRNYGASWRLTCGPADSTVAQRLIFLLTSDPTIVVKLDGTTLATGRVVDLEIGGDRSPQGSYVNVSGTDALGLAVRSQLPLGFPRSGGTLQRNMTLAEVISTALAPWDVAVTGTNEINRAAVTTRLVRVPPEEATAEGRAPQSTRWVTAPGGGRYLDPSGATPTYRDSTSSVGATAGIMTGPEKLREVYDDRAIMSLPGQTVGDWLTKVLKDQGLLAWGTATGEVFIGSPNYGTGSVLTVERKEIGNGPPEEGTILDGKWIRRYGDQPTHIYVSGRVGRNGATRVSYEATDDTLVALGWHMRRVESDDKIRSQAKAQERAEELLREAQLQSYVYECTIAGHGVGVALPAIDCMITVKDPLCGLNGVPLYCIARSFEYGPPPTGASVNLTLVRPDLWGAE